ncbi:MAG: hypothetical protein PHN68_04630 [Prolixibacteraceae bacterium]|jgi:triacylglycerol esterase/lipase EstA (alpha/beta hydrolase family)|nr:hypothetical protein [Prolixibacteraceae bacterium]NLO04123.1 hypothetical protein [Bacteroidales bacterium]
MKELLKKNYITVIFTLAGALGGFLYWKYIGCLSGTCMIQSVWYWSTLWAGTVGYLAGDFLQKLINKKKGKSTDHN